MDHHVPPTLDAAQYETKTHAKRADVCACISYLVESTKYQACGSRTYTNVHKKGASTPTQRNEFTISKSFLWNAFTSP